MTTTATKIWTEEALLALPHDGCKYELIHGELHTMLPAGLDHAVMGATVASLIHRFCHGKGLGVVMDGQTGFYMKNGDLLSPDVSFLSEKRWKSRPPENRHKFFRGSPDLAVEILTPEEPRYHIDRKIKAYLENDTSLVWVIDLLAPIVTIHTRAVPSEEIIGHATVTGYPALPGLSFVVASLFEDDDGLWE